MSYQTPNESSQIQAKQDDDQLALLSILWKIYAGVLSLITCFGLVYMSIGVFLGTMIGASPGSASKGEGLLVGGIFTFVGFLLIAISGAAVFFAWSVANNLKNRTAYTMCFVVACIVCLSFPIGTAIGVFTLVVLSRPTVKTAFGV